MNINLTMLGQAIAFAIFVWFCMRYVWPPIIEALAKREARIADGLAAAEKAHVDLEQAAQSSAEMVKEGREQAQAVLVQAQKRADDMVEEAKAQARVEGEKIIATARAHIDQERNQVREALRGEVAALAIRGAEQILMHEVDASAHSAMLDKLAAEL